MQMDCGVNKFWKIPEVGKMSLNDKLSLLQAAAQFLDKT